MFRSWTPRFFQGLTSIFQRRPESLRLTFRYDQSGITLIRKTRRGKAAPQGDDGGRPLAPDKIFLEVRARDSRSLYRRTLRDPIPQSAEVFDPSGVIKTVPVRKPSGVFSVVIPAGIGADHLTILAGPAVELAAPGFALQREARGQTREIFRMRLEGD